MASRKVVAVKRRQQTEQPLFNVFSAFENTELKKLKEAFSMIDLNHDGFIDSHDLRGIFSALGMQISEASINEMMHDLPCPINFTTFLKFFHQKLVGMDTEVSICNAFAKLDQEKSGFIEVEKFRKLMTTVGDCFTEKQINELLNHAPVVDGKLNYIEFTHMMKHGGNNDE